MSFSSHLCRQLLNVLNVLCTLTALQQYYIKEWFFKWVLHGTLPESAITQSWSYQEWNKYLNIRLMVGYCQICNSLYCIIENMFIQHSWKKKSFRIYLFIYLYIYIFIYLLCEMFSQWKNSGLSFGLDRPCVEQRKLWRDINIIWS